MINPSSVLQIDYPNLKGSKTKRNTQDLVFLATSAGSGKGNKAKPILYFYGLADLWLPYLMCRNNLTKASRKQNVV